MKLLVTDGDVPCAPRWDHPDKARSPGVRIMHTNYHRPGFVRFQQELAREALRRGSVGAARVALRILQADDFAGGAAVSESFIAVLRNPRSSEDEVLAAIRTLLDLGPAGGR